MPEWLTGLLKAVDVRRLWPACRGIIRKFELISEAQESETIENTAKFLRLLSEVMNDAERRGPLSDELKNAINKEQIAQIQAMGEYLTARRESRSRASIEVATIAVEAKQDIAPPPSIQGPSGSPPPESV
jgi:hypothetical protein